MEEKKQILFLIKRILLAIVVIATIVEMIFFPSIANLFGCILVCGSLFIFSSVVKNTEVIVEHPFSFIVYFQFLLANIISIVGTLLDGNPISKGLCMPDKTFILQFVLFCCVSLSFYLSVNITYKDNIFRRTLFKMKFFNVNKTLIWFFGGIGILVQLYKSFKLQDIEYGDVSGKFLWGITYLQYFPLILFFPDLIHISTKKEERIFLIVYIMLIIVISFFSNSRKLLINSFGIVAILAVLYFAYKKKNVMKRINIGTICFLGVAVCLINSFLSLSSLSMLSVRGVRDDVSSDVLFSNTIDVFFNDNKSAELKKQQGNIIYTGYDDYSNGWTEEYISNFMLNRFGNMRVVDETLYYADRIGYGNDRMKELFMAKIAVLFPAPILKSMGFDIDKSEYQFSPGDYLYYIGSNSENSRWALGGYRVTSIVGDGLATFGYFCFPIIILLLFISFRLLDTFVIRVDGVYSYAAIGLVSCFEFFGMYRNSIGIINMVSFVFRGYLQLCFTFLLVSILVKLLLYRRIF